MADPTRPRVVMVVNNGIANDARVIKSARTLHRAGAEVVVLGVASPGRPRQETVTDGIRYVRLPVLPARGLTPAYAVWAGWRRVGRLRPATAWRWSAPVTRYYARVFVPELRALAPDVVHAHDVQLLGSIAAAFSTRPGPAVVYDAHEYVAGLAVSGARTQRAVDAWAALERAHIGSASRVVTVAPGIARRLQQDHQLADTPAVVFNAPLAWSRQESSRALRQEAGADAATPLLVYSGALSAARGVDTVVRALPHLPGAVLAVVAVPYPHPLQSSLVALARDLGVDDRVRFVPPVPSHEVPAYLSGADVAVSPIIGDSASYDMALPNKLFEFVHAGLPIATSDIAAMSAFVEDHGLGRVFRQGDPRSCAEAVTAVLADPPTVDTADLRRTYSWQGQEASLVGVYRGLAAEHPALERLELSREPWSPAEMVVEFG